jgi:hypothetical protein
MSTTKRLHFKIGGRENGPVAIGGPDLNGPKWRKIKLMEIFMQSLLEIGIM